MAPAPTRHLIPAARELKVEMEDANWAFPKPVQGMSLIASFQNLNIFLVNLATSTMSNGSD